MNFSNTSSKQEYIESILQNQEKTKTNRTNNSEKGQKNKTDNHVEFKSSLVLRKLQNTKEDKQIMKELNNLMNDPDKFFWTHYGNKEVVFGKRFQENNNLEWQSILMKRKKGTIVRSTKKDQSVASFKDSTLNLTAAKKITSGRAIDENEVKKIFDHFKNVEKENQENKLVNSNSTKNLLYKTSTQFKNQLFPSLKRQEKILKEQKIAENRQKKMADYLAKKLKRNNTTTLLINSINDFRIKSEIRAEAFNYYTNDKALAPIKWYTDLRRNPSTPTKYYVNVGNIKNPFLVPLVKNPTKIEDIEIIRKPNTNLDEFSKTFVDKECSLIKTFQNDDMYKDKFFGKNIFCTNFKKINTSTGFYNLEIKGKKLLDFEQENAKLIKYKKIASQPKKEGKKKIENNNSYVFKENIYYPNLKSNPEDFMKNEDDEDEEVTKNQEGNKEIFYRTNKV